MQPFRELTPGVIVATEPQLMTCTTAVAGPDGGCLLIDPAVTADDLTALAAALTGAGLAPRAGFATHPHWDHLLWSRALGDVPRYAAAACVADITEAERERAAQYVESRMPGHELDLIARLTALPDDAGPIPWDGPEARPVVHSGHAPGHAAVFLPETGVLVAGDMLSDMEIPILDLAQEDAIADYYTGLDRLAAAGGVRWLVPGHGAVTDGAGFRARVDADRRYLDRLAAVQPLDESRPVEGWLVDVHQKQTEYAAARR
jgi:glyoxylase-like metal-dependent hydrolase (beta-lactamase superfamily II)